MSEEWTDTITEMGEEEFLRLYADPRHHAPALKAESDQAPLKTRYSPNADAPTGEASKVETEKIRRGLTYPDSWIAAGLVTPPTAITIR